MTFEKLLGTLVTMKKKEIAFVICLLIIVAFGKASFAQQISQISPQLREASKLINEKKWVEAAVALEKITKDEPKNGRAWFLLGTAAHNLGQYEKAVAAYERNIPISNNPSAMYNLACAYSRLKNTDKAFEWLEKALKSGAAQTVNIQADEDLVNLRGDARFKQMEDIANRATKPCMYLPEARQFDFWLGEWDVFPSQAPVGQAAKIANSKIEQISEGCGLLENWTSTGNNGKSINYYDSSTKKWYQHWIGSGGGALRYEGNFAENAMKFEGSTIGKDGKKTLQKLTFFKLDENTVRQLAEISNDEGKTWSISYDFRYERKR